jgi:hypothetical protein
MSAVAVTAGGVRERDFFLTVMGRTLEHLGVQMYKRRDAAIAELVANCWDAGATRVEITLPDPKDYEPSSSEVVIVDDGVGMAEADIEDAYLVVGRNRRQAGQSLAPGNRSPMGRKGIGKLAGFGLARRMVVETWQRDSQTTTITLDVAALKQPAGSAAEVRIPGRVSDGPPENAFVPSGTRLTLTGLKHKTAVEVGTLEQALARRFSRTVRGKMEITINGRVLPEPSLEFDVREPPGGDNWFEHELADGNCIRYWYGFTKKVIQSSQLRGWTIHVRGKTAQAPNFFFGVEGTASGQHGTKYLTGVIEADYLDVGEDDESDLISTDRQEIDWEDESTRPLHDWGDEVTRKVLRDRSNRKGIQIERRVFDVPELRERIERFEPATQERVKTYMRKLGDADADDEKVVGLAEQIILAFEYQNFHDVIEEIDAAGDPAQLQTLLEHLHEWKVLESRAILEIINGRVQIIDKLAELLADDAPETAHKIGDENLHDLLADYPWMINPEWQVLSEEKTLTRQVREWGAEAEGGDDAKRYDFLALKGDERLVLVELKRRSHAVQLEDVNRLQEYRVRLEAARGPIEMVLISGGQFNFRFTPIEDLEVLTWDDLHARSRSYYEHYRAVLTGEADDPDFDRKRREVHRTRAVLRHGSYRGERRKEGLGEQETTYREPEAAD